MKQNNGGMKLHSSDMAQVGLICAVLCIISPIAIAIPLSPVPLSFSLVAIFLSVYVSGYRRALMGCGLYLLLGGIGLPVYAGGMAGIGRLFGPTGGYLFGYLAVIYVFGKVSDRSGSGKWLQVVGMLLGLISLYGLGTVWLKVQSGMDLWTAFMVGTVPYIPADLVKIVFSMLGGRNNRKRIRNNR